MIDLKQHLMILSGLHGPTGYEGAIRAEVARVWAPLTDDSYTAPLGDLIAIKRGTGPEPRPKLMVCAHMDEIGLIVKSIEQGFLRVSRLGGIDARTLPGLPVIVHGREAVPGVVGLPPPFDPVVDADNYPKLTDLWIDLGLPEQRVHELVRPGDVITPDLPTLELAGRRLAGKAIDDRACIAVITLMLDGLQGRAHAWDIIAVASTQEENGVSGAGMAAETLRPSAAIALDVTFATQPGMSDGTFDYGAGVPVSLGANFHPALYDAILKAAEQVEITTLPDPLPMHSGTDGWPIQVAAGGVPTALVNLVIRNMHSTVETVDLGDIERTARLLVAFATGLAPDFTDSLIWDEA